MVHLQDVHKEHTNVVPNSISGRETIDIEIFGMEGIPFEDLERHQQKKIGGEKRKYEDPELLREQLNSFASFTNTSVSNDAAHGEHQVPLPNSGAKKIKIDGAVLVYSSDISPVFLN